MSPLLARPIVSCCQSNILFSSRNSHTINDSIFNWLVHRWTMFSNQIGIHRYSQPQLECHRLMKNEKKKHWSIHSNEWTRRMRIPFHKLFTKLSIVIGIAIELLQLIWLVEEKWHGKRHDFSAAARWLIVCVCVLAQNKMMYDVTLCGRPCPI